MTDHCFITYHKFSGKYALMHSKRLQVQFMRTTGGGINWQSDMKWNSTTGTYFSNRPYGVHRRSAKNIERIVGLAEADDGWRRMSTAVEERTRARRHHVGGANEKSLHLRMDRFSGEMVGVHAVSCSPSSFMRRSRLCVIYFFIVGRHIEVVIFRSSSDSSNAAELRGDCSRSNTTA